jgi:tetratricopeptide (TPR) repeat protein
VNVSSRRRLFSILGGALLVVEPLSAAQTGARTSTDSGPVSGRDVVAAADPTPLALDPRIPEAHDLYWDHQVMESLQLFEDVIDGSPESYEPLWAAARSAIALGLLSRGREIQNRWYQAGESYARRATEVEPEGLVGLYWLLSAKGLRAAQTWGREASALGGEVYDLAHEVLEMDSLHAGAYHALGVLNYRVRRLSAIERFVARNFLGADVMNNTTWEDAERYLTRAVELSPDYILFHLDLGRMYLARDRTDEAQVKFQRVLELPAVEPPDTRFQSIARRRLEDILD